MSQPSVLVIGAGIAGLSTALHLVRAGWEEAAVNVTVIDRGAIGCGSSSLSLGIVETQYVNDIDVAVRVYGHRFFDSLSNHHGLRFIRNGYLRVAETADDLALFEKSVVAQRSHGVTDARVLSPEQAAQIAPGLDIAPIVGGLWGPSDGFIDGYAATTLLADLVTHSGGRVLQRTELLEATHQNGHWRCTTSRGVFEADIVVNAAGAWAGEIGSVFGASLEVIAERHQAVVIERSVPEDPAFPCFIDHVPGSDADSLSLRWESDSQLIACLHSETAPSIPVDPNSYDPRCDPAFVEEVVERIAQRFPSLEARVGRGWAGLYPMSRDGLPVVGRHPNDESLVCVLGGGGNGIQLAPAMGMVGAAAALGRPSSLPGADDHWSPNRVLPGNDVAESVR